MKKILIFLSVVGLFACTGFISPSANDAISYVYVDVKGEVVNPGVYRVSDTCRVFQVLEIAGGLTDNSDTSKVNLACKIADEQMISIPSYKVEEVKEESELVNINTANITALDELPNIGYSTANAIIEYRKDNGPFATIEDLKNVSGIGEATYEKIKDLITV